MKNWKRLWDLNEKFFCLVRKKYTGKEKV